MARRKKGAGRSRTLITAAHDLPVAQTLVQDGNNMKNYVIVIAEFNTSDQAIVPLVSDYLKAWIRANRTWIRIWRSDSIEEERLDFYSEFLADPCVETDGNSIRIMLEARPLATRWKDWAVFIVNDISKVFPELKFERFLP